MLFKTARKGGFNIHIFRIDKLAQNVIISRSVLSRFHQQQETENAGVHYESHGTSSMASVLGRLGSLRRLVTASTPDHVVSTHLDHPRRRCPHPDCH